MRKVPFIIITFLFLFSSPIYVRGSTDDGDNNTDYEYAVENSDYDRIVIIDGIWYGIINVSDTWVAPRISGADYTEFYIQFTRDLSELKSLTYDYILEDYCTGLEIGNICVLGDKVSGETGTEQVFNKYVDGSFREALTTKDNIGSIRINDVEDLNSRHNMSFDVDNHDFYYIRSTFPDEIKEVTILSFEFRLTVAEIVDLKLDIQTQFNNEAEAIIDNPLYTQAQKEDLISALLIEYDAYQNIDTDTVFESFCIGEQCTAENDNSTPTVTIDDILENGTLWERIEAYILNFVLICISMLLGGIAAYALTLYITKSIGKGSKAIGLGFWSIISTSGRFWGENMLKGTAAAFSAVGNGIKALFRK